MMRAVSGRSRCRRGSVNSVSCLIGPAIAGGLIATVGVAVGFHINAASYLIVIAALLALRSSELIARPVLGQTKGNLREGFAYVRSHPEVARPLIVMSITGAIAPNFPTTFPSMVRFGIHRGAGSVGAAMSVSAIGSILGGIYIAGIKPDGRRLFQSVNTVFVQQATEPAMQGRVMALHQTALFGSTQSARC